MKTLKMKLAALLTAAAVCVSLAGCATGGAGSAAEKITDPYEKAERASYAYIAKSLGYVQKGNSFSIPDYDGHVEYTMSVQPNGEALKSLLGSDVKFDPTVIKGAVDFVSKNGAVGDYYVNYDIGGYLTYALWGKSDKYLFALPSVDALKDVYYNYDVSSMGDIYKDAGLTAEVANTGEFSKVLGKDVTGANAGALQELYVATYTYLLAHPEVTNNVSEALASKYFNLVRGDAKKLEPAEKNVNVSIGDISVVADKYTITIDTAFLRSLAAAAVDAVKSESGFNAEIQKTVDESGIKYADGSKFDVTEALGKVSEYVAKGDDTDSTGSFKMDVYIKDSSVVQREISSTDESNTGVLTIKTLVSGGKTEYDVLGTVNAETVRLKGTDTAEKGAHTGKFDFSVSSDSKNVTATAEYKNISKTADGEYNFVLPDYGVKISGTTSGEKKATADISVGGQVYANVAFEITANTSPAKIPALPKTEKQFTDITESGEAILSDIVAKATASDKNDIIAYFTKQYAPLLTGAAQ
ncbi:hypothetical protein FACS1894120_2930 [Clostridia bacterium]|nr:hypothetical protein FACS1894120_2930 [Clostridia bacterium]